jgi:cell division protein FtsB
MAIKRKPKRTLSTLQQKRLLRISLVIAFVVALWIIFAPGRGIFQLHQKKTNLARLEVEKELMIQENKDISQAIERLQNDEEYLEQVAREEHGMLKKNEMVFDFGKEKKTKD